MRAYDRSFGEVPWLSRDELRPRDRISAHSQPRRERLICVEELSPTGPHAPRGTTQDRHTPRDTEAHITDKSKRGAQRVEVREGGRRSRELSPVRRKITSALVTTLGVLAACVLGAEGRSAARTACGGTRRRPAISTVFVSTRRDGRWAHKLADVLCADCGASYHRSALSNRYVQFVAV